MACFRRPNVREVASLLQTNLGFWCNDCIETTFAVPPKQRIGDFTRRLGKARKYYEHTDKVICSICDDVKRCIRFVA